MDISLNVDPVWAAITAAFLFALVRPRLAWGAVRWAGQLMAGVFLLFVAAWPRR